tara:strand:- start:626 stop:1018 length:393 start_codon:yes stop_codon:yes gene_type:complete
MSEIKTNKLTGTSTAGSILVTGEGNSTTTSLQQGLAKTWVAATLAAVIYDSFNISSNTDEGTGDYKYGISNALSRSSAETHVSGISLGYTNIIRVKTSEASTSMIDIESMNTSASATDGHHSVGVHGDLA